MLLVSIQCPHPDWPVPSVEEKLLSWWVSESSQFVGEFGQSHFGTSPSTEVAIISIATGRHDEVLETTGKLLG